MSIHEVSATEERRNAVRAKTLRTGLIIYDEGRCTMSCMILETSSTGAKLRPQDPIWLPDNFSLRLPDGTRRHCDVARKDRTDVGVRYAD